MQGWTRPRDDAHNLRRELEGAWIVSAIPPDQLDDLKLDCLLGLIDKVAPSPDALRPALKPVAEAFVENFRRLQNQILLPAFAVAFATRFQHFRCLAIQEVKGRVITVERGDPDFAKTGETFTRLFRKDNLERTRKISEAGEGKPSSIIGEELRDGFHILGQILGQMSKAQAPVMLSGAREQFASHITATWTIFETLAGDLWEAAINGHPSGLSGLHGKTSSSSGQSEGRSIPLSQVERYGYDMTNVIGTVLKEKFNFTVLDSIRDAYSMAFHKIVHKAGAIYLRYYNETKNLTLAPKGQIGERITLDSEIVAILVNGGLERCSRLIFAVDEWLLRHPG